MRIATTLCLLLAIASSRAAEPKYSAELIFPFHPKHNHAPGIVEAPNGDLLVSWYRGSGERRADDVAVYGSRLAKGESEWSDVFLMVDTPLFPDCNTCMFIDGEERLWLFWPVIVANSWETAITHYLISSDYQGSGPPKWEGNGIILLKPENFAEEMRAAMKREREHQLTRALGAAAYLAAIKNRLDQKLYQRFGWQPRCKPTVLPSGRILLPLYTDTFSVSIMAISDDDGQSWFASKPLIGFGNIQPAVVRRDDGTLVAYMRENGPVDRVRVAESTDDGMTWGRVGAIDLPNPGAGVDAVRLANGNFVLIYNDTVKGRHSLAVSLSEDGGRTWPFTRHLEKHESGAYHYPAIIQGADGMIHAVYSYFVKDGKSMKHAAFDEEWIRVGDEG